LQVNELIGSLSIELKEKLMEEANSIFIK